MQIKCPQHKIPMEIEECNLNVLGTVYPATIGKCPSCQVRYINRMIFSACGTFQIDGISYQYSDELHTLFPPKDPPTKKKANNEPASQVSNEKPLSKKEQKAARKAEEQRKKKEKEAERKKKAREAGIREMRERILADNYEEYHIKNSTTGVKFVEEIPNICQTDNENLMYVSRVSFDMFGVKVKTPAHCCIRCNCAYIPISKKQEWREKAKKLKTSKHTSCQDKTLPQANSNTLKVEHILQRIPYLTSNSTYCPFCNRLFDRIIGVKYYSFTPVGERKQQYGTLNGCSHCKSVYANTDSLAQMRKSHWGQTIYTLQPSEYSSAAELMEATKLTTQQEEVSKLPLPYEDKLNSTENISRESKVVQVYVNKCHCQKCENKYKRITTVNRTAVVDTLDGSTANINVMFCKGCGQYFVSIVTLEQYRTIYGGLLMECKLSHDFSPNQYSWFDFAPDSILSRCGYTVKEGVSRDYRQAILRYILETGKATKYEIIEKINSFISFRDNQPKYEGACQRWREDIKFVNEYMIHKQKKVYGLEFKAAKKH